MGAVLAFIALVVAGVVAACHRSVTGLAAERAGWADHCDFTGCDERPEEKFYDQDSRRLVDLCELHADLMKGRRLG